VVARRGHPLANAGSASALVADEWLSKLKPEVATGLLHTVGAPEPRQFTECESFSTLLALLALLALLGGSDMLAVVQHPFLAMPQVAEQVQEIPIAECLPGLTVGLHLRADAPLTRPAAVLARLLAEIGRTHLQGARVLHRPGPADLPSGRPGLRAVAGQVSGRRARDHAGERRSTADRRRCRQPCRIRPHGSFI
jgi:hypothetical protein